jgi:hypothetical protein
MKAPWLLVSCLLLAAGSLYAQSNGPLVLPSTLLEDVRVPPPLRLAEKPLASPLAELPAAVFGARQELRQIQEWNAAGRQPYRIGFMRALPEARAIEISEVPAVGEVRQHAGGLLAERQGAAVWGAGVRVDEAFRLRLHLSGVHLPKGARMWVYGSFGEVVGPFGAELKDPKGGLWTPSVEGPEIRLEVEVPGGGTARFTVDRVAEILSSGLTLDVAADTSCFLDGRCIGSDRFRGIGLVRKAIAHLEIPAEPGFIGVCTGGLINDTDTKTVVPYLLTANHCLDTQADAAGTEAFFDFIRAQCDGPFPSLSRVPRVQGMSLVATGASSDYTLLRLSKLPPGRTLLGWSAAPVGAGTHLYRLSHPVYDGPGAVVWPQLFQETVVDSGLPASSNWPRPRFLYERQDSGGMWGGSSGSPVLLSSGQIVGQLTGAVGAETPAACDFRSAIVDGAFSATFTSIRGFLDPPAPCKPGPDTLCLLDNRFRVKVAWQNQFDGSSGAGKPIPRSNVTGFFSFGDPSNVELLVKMLDFGDVVKVFWGQLTNLQYNLEITDTRTGRIQNYTNTAGNCGGIDQDFANDLAADLATAPARTPIRAASCRAGANTLCLLKNRFAIEVDWRNPANGTSGHAGAAALSNLTGTFTFGDRSNVELMVKMIDFGNRVSLFWGALSDLDYTLKVTDTNTGAVKTYHSTAGKLCGGLDNNAF